MAGKYFRAAPLPQPPLDGTYSREYVNQLLRVIELYFSQLDNAPTLRGEGEYTTNPNGLFYSTVTQTLPAIDTATPIALENTYIGHDMTMNGGANSELTVDKSGIYNFQFNATLQSTNSSAKDIYVWINRSGTDIGYSARPYTISGSGTNRLISWNFNIDLQAGQYIEMYWASPDTTVSLTTIAASSPYPAVASAVMAVSFVSNLDGVTVATAP